MMNPQADITSQKHTLRQHMRQVRAGIVERDNKINHLNACLKGWDVLKSHTCMGAYWPMGSEVDPRPFLHHAYARGHQVALPRIEGQGVTLQFYAWDPARTLQTSDWKFLQPDHTQPQLYPTLYLVPLLVFDKCGNRLGYGQGHFDRMLQSKRSHVPPVVVGLAFDEQQVHHLPTDEYDQRMDYVCTPTQIHRF